MPERLKSMNDALEKIAPARVHGFNQDQLLAPAIRL
jgi:hypothetical protein